MQLYRTICQFQIPFTKSLDLFRSFTEPIILYNSENLFTLSDSQINKYKLDHNSLFEIALTKMPATQNQLKFIKFILGVNKSCPTMASQMFVIFRVRHYSQMFVIVQHCSAKLDIVRNCSTVEPKHIMSR